MLMVIDNVPTPTSCTRERAAAGPGGGRRDRSVPTPTQARPHMPVCAHTIESVSQRTV